MNTSREHENTEVLDQEEIVHEDTPEFPEGKNIADTGHENNHIQQERIDTKAHQHNQAQEFKKQLDTFDPQNNWGKDNSDWGGHGRGDKDNNWVKNNNGRRKLPLPETQLKIKKPERRKPKSSIEKKATIRKKITSFLKRRWWKSEQEKGEKDQSYPHDQIPMPVVK